MKKVTSLFAIAFTLAAMQGFAQNTTHYLTSPPPENKTMKPEETEYYSPVPPEVTPGKKYGDAPSDAVILFNGKNLDNWVSAQDTTRQAQWTVSNGIMTVKPGTGNIETKQRFEDYQLHLEWREPIEPHNQGQDRGNSGLFLASVGPGDDGYELQILDSYHASTYVDGQCGSVYKQYPPLVNACRPQGQWQTYDVIWTAPRFNPDGSVKSPARVIAFQNGVLIQNDVVLKGRTVYIGHPFYTDYGAAPIKLQDHHHKVSFRNIWVRPLK